jgi:hypothetical protein
LPLPEWHGMVRTGRETFQKRHGMTSGARGATFRRRVRLLLLAGALGALSTVSAPAAPAGPTQVDVKLVIATDVSHSIDQEEAQLQRQGIADLFLDPEVVKAIQSGPLGAIAVAMLDWAGYREDYLALDWTIVNDTASATALSQRIRSLPDHSGQRTSISNAIEKSILLLNGSDGQIVGTRKVIDVSGDGPNNDGVSLQHVHDTTANNGIIVNGLPIMDEASDDYFPDLDKYYDACVVAGKGSFLVVVKRFKDFGQAMRRKLVLEISSNESQIRQAIRELRTNPLLKKVATGAATAPQLQLRGGTKLYPGGCDKYGGWGAP